ncbi:MAG: homocitrate synthase [Dysgonamonadaceae bacterium]|jgi:homocitrate synthase NifV|nr:homocitrate synthase [Dysgonamonadaceae bacterium]
MNDIWIIDSTLRDGEQAPSVSFSRKEKMKIAQMLEETGINEIEAGTPAMGKEEQDTIRRIVRMCKRTRISVWSRALPEDVEQAALTEAEGIHIAFPLSNIQLSAMGKSRQWVEDTLPKIVEHARRYFKYVSIGAQDASRSDREDIFKFIEMVSSLNVFRIRLADTVGILSPMQTAALVSNVKNRYPDINIDFHVHNDLGMATANAFTAWQAGASSLSLTVNGLGERAGNAALEEVLMALKLAGKETNYNLRTLYPLCKYVSEASGRPIAESKPVCGGMAFSHESGIHAAGTLVHTLAFQPFDGREAGRESFRNLFGKHSGRGMLDSFLKEQNLPADEHCVTGLKKKIADIARQNKRNVSPAEIVELFREYREKCL